MKVHVKLYLKCPKLGRGGGVKLCRTQPGLKLDLPWSVPQIQLSDAIEYNSLFMYQCTGV